MIKFIRWIEKTFRSAVGLHYFFINTGYDKENDALIVELDYNQKMIEHLMKKGYGIDEDDPEKILMDFIRVNYSDVFGIISTSEDEQEDIYDQIYDV